MSTPTGRGRKVTPNNKAKTMSIFYAILGVVAVIGIASIIYYATSDESAVATNMPTPDTRPAPEQTTNPITTTDSLNNETPPGTTASGFYYQGDPNAPVTVMEYSDFQCPACANFATSSIYRRLHDEYVNQGKVYVIFHDFPLPYHDYAPIASEATRCAGEQGAYWQMHDILFERQSEWANPAATARFVTFAGQLGLDGDAFKSCLESGKYTQDIEAALQAAMDAEIPATPTFVVNGKQVNATLLLPTIDAELRAVGQ